MTNTWKVDIPDGQQGAVKVAKFEIPKGSVEGLRLAMAGRGAIPGWYTGLYRNGQLWMSDTPAEQRDHSAVANEIRLRGGRVLVMGLGLGMIVKQALECENVTHVDVVEIDPDVAALIGKHYAGPRCTIHVADAYTIRWPKGTRWAVAWHDIWPDLCEDNLPEMGKLARSYGGRTDWQGFWGKEILLRKRRATAGAWWR